MHCRNAVPLLADMVDLADVRALELATSTLFGIVEIGGDGVIR